MSAPVTSEGLLYLLARVPDPVLIADDGRRYIHANAPAGKLFGVPSEELLGKRIDDFLEPEFLSQVDLQWRKFLEDGVQSGPFRLLRQDGQVREVEFSAVANIQHGAHISFLRDVTEERNANRARFEAQKLIELALHAGRMGSWIWDTNTGTVTWNRILEEIYGLPPSDSTSGYDAFVSRIHPDDRETVRRTIADTPRTGAHYQLEYRITRTDGEVRWISHRGEVVLDDNGRNTGVTGVCWDITQSKMLEQEKIDRTRELARSNADLKRFAYIASHDLKEPLRNVCAFSQLLLRQISSKLNDEELEMLHLITGGAKRMSELIDGLLTYSQVSSDQDILLSEANLNDLLAQALNNLGYSIEETRAEIRHDPLPTLCCSPLHIIQIFQNLIGNAIKYCDKEFPRIHISAERNRTEWIFRVRDNGIGINPRYHDQIFTAFKRLHGREYAGTGVGLAICKALVEKQRGRIGVESEEGKGSTFFFSLPQ